MNQNRTPQNGLATGRGLDRDLDSLAVLTDRVRRSIYLHVCEQDTPSTRAEVAAALGVTRDNAAFHLEKLIDAGLLIATSHRLSGRTGPGAGRPAKLYARSPATMSVSLPPRNYELLARLQAELLEPARSTRDNDLKRGARAFGRVLGKAVREGQSARTSAVQRRRALTRNLALQGYEPALLPAGGIRLGNCPFAGVVSENAELVCGLNLALMEGVLDGAVIRDLEPRLEPSPGGCCVAFSRRRRSR